MAKGKNTNKNYTIYNSYNNLIIKNCKYFIYAFNQSLLQSTKKSIFSLYLLYISASVVPEQSFNFIKL